MFKTVLIAEDQECANISLRKTLEELGIARPDYVYYCDHALTRVQTAIRDGKPYDLLITDLSFEEDGSEQKLTEGTALIAAARQAQPDLKILVFSAEHKAAVIDMLFKDLNINGYVRKARRDAEELKLAIQNIYKNRQHLSQQLRQTIKQKNAYEFSEFDIIIISLISGGTPQKNIPAYLQKHTIRPSGLSSVEKRLNLMRDKLGVSNNEQLVALCKDMGVI